MDLRVVEGILMMSVSGAMPQAMLRIAVGRLGLFAKGDMQRSLGQRSRTCGASSRVWVAKSFGNGFVGHFTVMHVEGFSKWFRGSDRWLDALLSQLDDPWQGDVA